MANRKVTSREINREELRRYLSERGKLSHIFDNLEKLEDQTIEMDSVAVSRINSANSTRLALLKKYLPDEKSVEIKNADGETFKSDGKWTVEFINADTEDK
jgi:sulfatase maturation enzyme AslB (radical SAM superfamily)